MVRACMRFGCFLLAGLTLGLYFPFAMARLHAFITNNTLYGTERFRFEGNAKEMFVPFLIALLLTIPTLGLVWLWYSVKAARFYTRNTKVGDLKFDTTVTTWDLFVLVVVNLVLLVLTLGLAMPWIMLRNARFQLGHLVIAGELDYVAIEQSASKADAVGDGFAEAMDLQLAY